MASAHQADAGHSRTPSDDTSDTIEMDNLEELAITPDPRDSKRTAAAGLPNANLLHEKRVYFPDEHHDHEEDSGEEGEALLAFAERPLPRVRDVPLAEHVGGWVQARRIVVETVPTLLLTSVGLTFTGKLLNNVSSLQIISQVDELIMIIPVILNLKGNLEMSLSARLSTAANIGELDHPKARRQIIIGNLTLLQVQATVVSFVAALVAFALSRVMPTTEPAVEVARSLFAPRDILQRRRPRPIPTPTSPGGLAEFFVTASSAMLSASISSVLLGTFMCALVLVCRRFKWDPDNIAPPLAACLGDLVTLFLLAMIAVINIAFIDTPIPLIILIASVITAVGWTFVTLRNERVRGLLSKGWVPLFIAMVISCGTGIVLDNFVKRFDNFALLAAVVSGLPENVGSIFVSRLSTALHATARSITGLPLVAEDEYRGIKDTAQSPSHSIVILTLCSVAIPVEIALIAALRLAGWLTVPFVTLPVVFLFFLVTVITSLMLARYLTNFLWNRNLDPDMYALPILSAVVDLVGQLLLVACFEMLSHLGVPLKP
ncbi:hypothetical protein BC835DRAFT_1267406 [Cytidiella melzeri]|nr:hypothetical protein BC835DRAFT_1267406 [Cytidiella melzeri]